MEKKQKKDVCISTYYQPKTGVKCGCRRGVQRDNCPACEGTGWQIDFATIRARPMKENVQS